jgi:hypothetical protein
VSEPRAEGFGYVLPRVLLALAMFDAGHVDEEEAAQLLGTFEAADFTWVSGWPFGGASVSARTFRRYGLASHTSRSPRC